MRGAVARPLRPRRLHRQRPGRGCRGARACQTERSGGHRRARRRPRRRDLGCRNDSLGYRRVVYQQLLCLHGRGAVLAGPQRDSCWQSVRTGGLHCPKYGGRILCRAGGHSGAGSCWLSIERSRGSRRRHGSSEWRSAGYQREQLAEKQLGERCTCLFANLLIRAFHFSAKMRLYCVQSWVNECVTCKGSWLQLRSNLKALPTTLHCLTCFCMKYQPSAT